MKTGCDSVSLSRDPRIQIKHKRVKNAENRSKSIHLTVHRLSNLIIEDRHLGSVYINTINPSNSHAGVKRLGPNAAQNHAFAMKVKSLWIRKYSQAEALENMKMIGKLIRCTDNEC